MLLQVPWRECGGEAWRGNEFCLPTFMTMSVHRQSFKRVFDEHGGIIYGNHRHTGSNLGF
jgi:hypothetical protein